MLNSINTAASDPQTSKALLAIYQPLIVGLGAVVLASIGNTMLEWYRHYLTNRHRGGAVRRAILADLRVFQLTALSNLEHVNKPMADGLSFNVPISEDFSLYERNMTDIGYLKSEEVAAVIEAYSYLKALPQFLAAFGTIGRMQDIVLIAIVDRGNQEHLRSMAQKVASKIDAAVSALAPNVR